MVPNFPAGWSAAPKKTTHGPRGTGPLTSRTAQELANAARSKVTESQDEMKKKNDKAKTGHKMSQGYHACLPPTDHRLSRSHTSGSPSFGNIMIRENG